MEVDLSKKNKSGTVKTREDQMGFHPPSVSADWQRLGTSAFLPDTSPMEFFRENQMCSSSSSMHDSFFPRMNSTAAAWSFSTSIPHLHTDSSFIERAAKFSCFNPTSFPETSNHSIVPIDLLTPNCNNLRGFASTTAPASPSKLTTNHGSARGSPSFDPQKEDFFGEAASDSSSEKFCPKRRRKTQQDMELGEERVEVAVKENSDGEKKIEAKKSGVITKSAIGKQPKDSVSEASKEDYVHVRARRGQATNSHSLAERVRREKISQRMKLLQDLVPGCSKVTGKAVMLDEIINYVQSLQRQVEFLSMKLATVNPRLDFDAEALLSKGFRGGSSSAICLSSEAIRNQFHQSQQVMIQTRIPGLVNTPDGLGRMVNAQSAAMGGSKDLQQMSSWGEELSNVLQMNFCSRPPHNS